MDCLFSKIYVTPDAYVRTCATEIIVGHVSPEGIYVAGKYFLQGYSDKTDNVNVAIHEMAHALEHESFMDDARVDEEFKSNFAKFSAVSGPTFASALWTEGAICGVMPLQTCRNSDR